jgi:hypothetical protein
VCGHYTAEIGGLRLTQPIQFIEKLLDVGSVERRPALMNVGNLRRGAATVDNNDLGHPAKKVAKPPQQAEPDRLVVGFTDLGLRVRKEWIRQVVAVLPLFDPFYWLGND